MLKPPMPTICSYSQGVEQLLGEHGGPGDVSRSSVLHSKEREVLCADLWKEMLLPEGLLRYHFAINLLLHLWEPRSNDNQMTSQSRSGAEVIERKL